MRARIPPVFFIKPERREKYNNLITAASQQHWIGVLTALENTEHVEQLEIDWSRLTKNLLIEAVNQNNSNAVERLMIEFKAEPPLPTMEPKNPSLLETALFKHENLVMAMLLVKKGRLPAGDPLLKISSEHEWAIGFAWLNKLANEEEKIPQTYLDNLLKRAVQQRRSENEISFLLKQSATVSSQLFQQAYCRPKSEALNAFLVEDKFENGKVITDNMLKELLDTTLHRQLPNTGGKKFFDILSTVRPSCEGTDFINQLDPLTIEILVTRHWKAMAEFHDNLTNDRYALPEFMKPLLLTTIHLLDNQSLYQEDSRIAGTLRDGIYAKAQHLVSRMQNPADIVSLLDDILEAENENHFLSKRRGKITSAINGYHWQGREVSSQWVRLVEVARNQISQIVCASENHPANQNQAVIGFMNEQMNRWSAGFFGALRGHAVNGVPGLERQGPGVKV